VKSLIQKWENCRKDLEELFQANAKAIGKILPERLASATKTPFWT